MSDITSRDFYRLPSGLDFPIRDMLDDDIVQLQHGDLYALMDELDRRRHTIKDQIANAHSAAQERGEQVSADWLKRARGADTIFKNFRQKVQTRLTMLNKQQKERRYASGGKFANAFLEEARNVLPGPLYQTLIDRTATRIDLEVSLGTLGATRASPDKNA